MYRQHKYRTFSLYPTTAIRAALTIFVVYKTIFVCLPFVKKYDELNTFSAARNASVSGFAHRSTLYQMCTDSF